MSSGRPRRGRGRRQKGPLLDRKFYAILIYDLVILPIELSDGRRVRVALLMQDIAELMRRRLALRRDAVENLEAPMPGLPNRLSLRNSGARGAGAVAYANIAGGLELRDLPNIDLIAIAAELDERRRCLDTPRPALDLHGIAVPLGLHARALRDWRVAGGRTVDIGQM